MGAPSGGWVRSCGAGGALLGLGPLVARPGAGELRDPMAGAVVGEPADEAEDRALDEEGGEQLDEAARLAVLRVGWLVVVDQAPDLLEDLAADDAGDEAEDDAEGGEDELHGLSRGPSSCGCRAARGTAPCPAGEGRPRSGARAPSPR